MPLPAALAARLARRGILRPGAPGGAGVGAEASNEEIIAEDYDSARDSAAGEADATFWEGADAPSVDLIKGHPGCPNKSNIYHECTPYCVKRWRNGITLPPDHYTHLKNKLLDKYPLPNGWQEVYDEGCAQHYYWNVYNNLVSWLPPTHPKAAFSESASHLREERLMKEGDESDNSSDELSDQEVPQRKKEEPRVERERERDRYKRGRDNRDRPERRYDKRSKVKDNDLDPMDPAAYSDVPRGEWSSGLENRSDAKTGVDTTATGPLFQMRPYPSPGAILMANNKGKPPLAGKKGVSFPEAPK
ncbi:poly-glutamine tract binding protein 1 [Arctopsyche grandis]|uniref:poly-glutamine tract binding protein 1 n=1 Tax=Arctopsyche grandis TaxID=121162 RepID=UPI00406D87DD